MHLSFFGKTAAVLLLPLASLAQTAEKLNETMAASTCECMDKRLAARSAAISLAKDEANQIIAQCIMAAAGKDMAGIQKVYGADAFSNTDRMRQMGREVAGVMMQNCPSFTTISLAVAEMGTPPAASATTGQTVGQLGKLQGTALALLSVQTSKTEKAEFAWLRRFARADELLPQLLKLQGRQVRVSWQEVELLQPDTQKYRKVREITALELL